MAKLGYFLFFWANLEGQLPKSIRQFRRALKIEETEIPNGLAKQLAIWHDLAHAHPHNYGYTENASAVRDQALALRDIRNTIVHGLRSGNSMPRHGHAHITCFVGGTESPTGKTVRYTLDDLEHFLQAADACRRAFIQLRFFDYRLDQPPPPPA